MASHLKSPSGGRRSTSTPARSVWGGDVNTFGKFLGGSAANATRWPRPGWAKRAAADLRAYATTVRHLRPARVAGSGSTIVT